MCWRNPGATRTERLFPYTTLFRSFLGRSLAGDELDVVDHEEISVAQLLLEPYRLVGAERCDELDHELLGRHVDDLRARTPSPEFVADGVQQVRLAAPGTAVEEEWVERDIRTEEHTYELKSLMRITLAVFCLHKKQQ